MNTCGAAARALSVPGCSSGCRVPIWWVISSLVAEQMASAVLWVTALSSASKTDSASSVSDSG